MNALLDFETLKAAGGAVAGMVTAVGTSLILVKRWTAGVEASIRELREADKRHEVSDMADHDAHTKEIAELRRLIGEHGLNVSALAREQVQIRHEHGEELRILDGKMDAMFNRLDAFKSEASLRSGELSARLGEVSGKLSVLLSNRESK